MSSLRKSWRVRPKSPPLQPPSAALIKNSVRAADEFRICSLARIGKYVSGIAKYPEVTDGGDGGQLQCLLPVRCRHWFCRARVRSGPRGGSGWLRHLRAGGQPWLSPAAAKPHPPEIQ